MFQIFKRFITEKPILSIILFLTIFAIYSSMGNNIQSSNTKKNIIEHLSYSEFKKLIKSNTINYVTVFDNHLKGTKNKNNNDILYTTNRINPDDSLIPLMEKYNVEFNGYHETENFLITLIGFFAPFIMLFIIYYLVIRFTNKNTSQLTSLLGTQKKEIIAVEKPNITFEDMAGNEEAKEEVKELVDFLKNADKYLKLGAKIPKGILLVGPPGTGKTLLAKTVAGEAHVPFYSVTGSSFIEMFVGMGASRVRDLFEVAKNNGPSIIFIDEIDAIGKKRDSGGIMSGNDEREQTLNQLLAEMDGFSSSDNPVIVLAATNRPEILDAALLRPGRFDRQVLVDAPDLKGRLEILNVHIKNIKVEKDLDLHKIAQMTAGLVGADLANIINEAALLAGRNNQDFVTFEELREAIERNIAGLKKKSRTISENEKKIIAYHEMGHAFIAEITPEAKKVNKVSIISRGLAALGYTLNTPEENKYLMQKEDLIAEIDVLLGGRAAEEIFIGKISTGASNDLERATDIIKSMIFYYGMSNITGLMVLEKQQSSFLNQSGFNSRNYSEETAKNIDDYIKKLLEERYYCVKENLNKNKEIIEEFTQELLKVETLEGSYIREKLKENKMI